MSKTTNSSNDTAFFVAVALTFGSVLVFAFTYTGLSPESFMGRIQKILVHPITSTLIFTGFCVVTAGLLVEAVKSAKRKEAALNKLRHQQDLLIKPVRIHDLSVKTVPTDVLGLTRIPAMLAQLARRGDKGIPDLVDAIIGYAIQARASDVHLESSSEYATVRYRQDGILSDVGQIPMSLMSRVSSRLRVLANLTIFEKGKPQDGRIEVKWLENTYDVRISFMPTLHGDKIVVRLFESGGHQFNLQYLGLSANQMELMSDLLLRSQGTILLTGPTGSGKTTTIYSSVKYIIQNRGGRTNIVTIEDPIEREITGVNQTQINSKRDLTFASGLRSILRQDPDVIIVGEVRDFETARICVQAGLTGHLVVSTIHADSSVGVFNRLIEMKIEPFLLASSVCGVLAQRLVKRNCPHCSEPIVPSLKAMKFLGIQPTESIKFMRGSGCDKCNYKGFKGRVGLFEILIPSKRLKDALQTKKSTSELHQIALDDGLVTLREDGLQKLKDGIVDIEELVNVLI